MKLFYILFAIFICICTFISGIYLGDYLVKKNNPETIIPVTRTPEPTFGPLSSNKLFEIIQEWRTSEIDQNI